MSYATPDDIYARYSQTSVHLLTDQRIDQAFNLSPEALTAERLRLLNVALEDAAATIDGYIDGRAVLPLQTVPTVLVRAACVLARFALEDGQATDKATKDKDDILRLLEKVSTGEVSLGLSRDAERPTGGDVAMIQSAGSVWARHKAKGFI